MICPFERVFRGRMYAARRTGNTSACALQVKRHSEPISAAHAKARKRPRVAPRAAQPASTRLGACSFCACELEQEQVRHDASRD